MSNLTKALTPQSDVVIGSGKSAGIGQPGALPANYNPNLKEPLSLYRNVAGCVRKDIMDYIYAIDSWSWKSYDVNKWPCADLDFPDLDPEKKYDIWPFKPDLNQVHWVNLHDKAFMSGVARKGYILGYTCPEAFESLDAQAALVQFEDLLKANNEAAITAAGFKSKEHLEYMIHSTTHRIKKAYAETQSLLDTLNAEQSAAMNKNVEAVKAGGLLDPIKGVSMEDWAAGNAKIGGGMPLDQVLKVLGVEKPVWDAVSAEWMSRMQQDTTFAIAKVYGEAFTNPNMGKFAGAGGGSAAGGNAKIDAIKNDLDEYVKIMCHQNMGAAQGIDANSILQQYGLTAADWGTIGMHWAPQLGGNLEVAMKMSALMDKYNAQFAGAKAGSDIEF